MEFSFFSDLRDRRSERDGTMNMVVWIINTDSDLIM
jgi:hypothetical protein